MIGQQVTLSGYAGWLKVADTVIEAVLVCPELGQRHTLPLGPLTLAAMARAIARRIMPSWTACWPRKGAKALRRRLRAQGFDKAQYVNDQQRQQVDAPALALRPSGHAAVLAGVRSEQVRRKVHRWLVAVLGLEFLAFVGLGLWGTAVLVVSSEAGGCGFWSRG